MLTWNLHMTPDGCMLVLLILFMFEVCALISDMFALKLTFSPLD